MIDQWKIEKIRHYHKQGWLVRDIAKKLHIESYEIYDIIYDQPQQSTDLGYKDEAYYADEDDYARFIPPGPYRSLTL